MLPALTHRSARTLTHTARSCIHTAAASQRSLCTRAIKLHTVLQASGISSASRSLHLSTSVMAAASDSSAVKGSWTTSVDKGEFKRKESQFRNWITPDGEFKAEADRYHLYVSLACPWAHRTLIVRALKGLESVISYTVVDWHLGDRGWVFSADKPLCSPDPVHGFERLRQVYELADPHYSGNVTVPILYDKKNKKIVNNESSEIIQMLNSEFNSFSATPEQAALDLYPSALKADIDEVNAWIYPQINNGVYRCGFATEQGPYDQAFKELFAGLDRVEGILSKRRYLNSNEQLTLADVRLFTTLIRFDTVYHGHFKANLRKLKEYPALYGYMKEIYQRPEIRQTVSHEHIKLHYMGSHKSINPHGIISHGPPLEELDEPHGREKIGKK